MKGERIKTNLLSVRILPNADKALLKELDVPEGHKSLGIFTTDCDDVSYAALDEATKKARVSVAYARSMYAGSSNASTAFAGEFIGILSGDNPEDVKSGIDAAVRYMEEDAAFYSANDDGSVVYFAHCISRTGSYLSAQAHVPEGTPMAYLIAPPLEASVGLDYALKAADVTMRLFYGPPTETNFAGALLTGEQSACKAACEAFAQAVCDIAALPVEDRDDARTLSASTKPDNHALTSSATVDNARTLHRPELAEGSLSKGTGTVDNSQDMPYGHMSRRPIPVIDGKAQYVDYGTGAILNEKPEDMTHLSANLLVPKTHPRIAFRGKLDTLMAQIMEVQALAHASGREAVVNDLSDVLACVRQILGAEVKEEPLPEIRMLGMDSAELRYASHHIRETLGIDHPVPDYRMGMICVSLNMLRTTVRETELSALRAFTDENGICTRRDIVEALNRLSSCVYIIFCRKLSGYYGK